jgi:hypothetical protein
VAATWATLPIAVACVATACVVRPNHRPDAPTHSAAFGFAAPVVVQNASFRWHWVVACFALRDTDADGRLAVMIGRHGETWGDALEPFLLIEGRAPEGVDEYVTASPDGRFVAVISANRLIVVDAKTQRRVDLSALGASRGVDASPALPHPAISFSEDGRAAFVRRSSDRSEIVAMELPSGRAATALSTIERVSRFQLLGDRLKVWVLPPTVEDAPLRTTLAPRRCRGQATSFSVFRTGADPARVIDVPIGARSARTPREKLQAVAYECTSDGMPGLATSNGENLVAAAKRGFDAERGPLRWTRSELWRNSCH